jgi:peptidyl-prolyl cis-trans isomerase D
MAVIGKIRERSGLLLVIIGGALAAFILTDLFSARGSGPQDQVLGVVGGEEISLREFETRVSDEIESYRNDFGQQVTGQMQEQVRASVWSEMVKAKVMLEQVKDAGFSLTKPEYDDIRFGNNILPDFSSQPNFQGPDGRPDRSALQQYFSSVQLNAPVYHEIQKRRITENRLYAKYTNLVKGSAFVNSAQARDEYLAKNTRSSFNFVAKRYDSEPDTLYTVDEKDLRRFHDRHKNDRKYRQTAARRFSYVVFPVKASEEDRAQARRELEEMREEFANAESDSLFVVMNSEQRVYNIAPYMEGSADTENDARIINAEVGEVVGPFREGEMWKLVKVVEMADVPEARVRHILLSTQQGKGEDEQKKRADSLLTVVKRDRSKFEAMVTKFSDDPGSVNTGGVYEWFDKTRMVPEFTAASFDEKVGAITIAKTTYGFHIVEVLGQRDRQERRVASIERMMRPTPATFKEVYKQANEFSLRYKKDMATFRNGAEELGLEVTDVDELRPDMRFVSGLTNPNSTITWVNRAKVGAVSEPLDAGDNYVVAILTGIREEGPPALDDVREIFTQEVLKEKKGDALVTRMQGNTDLPSLASDLGVSVQTATDLMLNSFSIPGGYSEFGVIGKIFALQTGQTSVPLRGENAVYVVDVTNLTVPADPEDVSTERDALEQRLRSRTENAVFNALREAAGVQDNRSRYY